MWLVDRQSGYTLMNPYKGGRKTLPFLIVDLINANEPMTKKELLAKLNLKITSYVNLFACLSKNKIIAYDKKMRIVKADNFYRYMIFCYKGKRRYTSLRSSHTT